MQGRDFLPQLFSLRGRDKTHPGSLAQCCPPAARLPLPTPTIGWPGRPSLPPGCCTGLSGHRLPKGREAHAVLVGDAQLGLAGGQLAGRAEGEMERRQEESLGRLQRTFQNRKGSIQLYQGWGCAWMADVPSFNLVLLCVSFLPRRGICTWSPMT